MRFLLLMFISLLFASGCSEDKEKTFQKIEKLTVETIKSGSETLSSYTIDYQQIKIDDGTYEPVYALLVHPENQQDQQPVIINMLPYDLLDWSGEAIDQEALTTGTITPLETLLKRSLYYTINGISVLHIYGRFHTGGDLNNEVHDVVTGFNYLKESGHFDLEQIGIQGGSWGGFEALYGSANSTIKPVAGVALYPPSNFEKIDLYIDTLSEKISDNQKLTKWLDNFQKYRDRIYGATGGDPDKGDYQNWKPPFLTRNLNTPFLIVHDQHDTLVPASQSEELIASAPDQFSPIWLYRDTPIDFNTSDLTHHADTLALQSLSIAYIVNRVATQNQLTIYLYKAPFEQFLRNIHTWQLQGKNIDWILPRLKDFTNSRITLLADSGASLPGATYITQQLNAIWCTNHYTPALVDDQLDQRPVSLCNK